MRVDWAGGKSERKETNEEVLTAFRERYWWLELCGGRRDRETNGFQIYWGKQSTGLMIGSF